MLAGDAYRKIRNFLSVACVAFAAVLSRSPKSSPNPLIEPVPFIVKEQEVLGKPVPRLPAKYRGRRLSAFYRHPVQVDPWQPLRAPAQETGTHSIAQLLRRLDRPLCGWLRRRRGRPRDLRCFLRGPTCLKVRHLLGGQLFRLGVDHFGRRAVEAGALTTESRNSPIWLLELLSTASHQKGHPSLALLLHPLSRTSRAASQSERRRPLWTSRRCSSLQSDQGTMWEARSNAGSVMPVSGHRLSQ
jgi:hypothetical protein